MNHQIDLTGREKWIEEQIAKDQNYQNLYATITHYDEKTISIDQEIINAQKKITLLQDQKNQCIDSINMYNKQMKDIWKSYVKKWLQVNGVYK